MRKVEKQEVIHGLIERHKIHNRVWDRDNNGLGRYRHERWEVGGGGQIHGLQNCVAILDTVQSCLNLRNLMKRHSIEWIWALTNGRKKVRLIQDCLTLWLQTRIWYTYYAFSFRASVPYTVIASEPLYNGSGEAMELARRSLTPSLTEKEPGHCQVGMCGCNLFKPTSDYNPSLLVEQSSYNLTLAVWKLAGRLNWPLDIFIGNCSQLLNDSRPHLAAIKILSVHNTTRSQ